MFIYVILMTIIVSFMFIRINRLCGPYFSFNKKIHNAGILFLLCILWVLLAFKGSNIGSDTPSYINFFYEFKRNLLLNGNNFFSIFINHTRFEIGYVVLNNIIANIFGEVQWLFVIIATFEIFVLYKFLLCKSKNIYMSIFLFISLRFFYFTMSGLRQTIAIFICVIAYQYIEKRKPLLFYLYVIMAMQFHITAFVFLILYPISFIEFNIKNVFFIGSVCIIVFLCFDYFISTVLDFMPNYYSHYRGTVRFEENKLGNIIVACMQFVFLIFILFSQYNTKHNTSYDEASMMKFMILISFLLSLISLKATTLDRLFYYFYIYIIIYIPNVIYAMPFRNKIFFTITVCIFSFLYNIAVLYFRPEWLNITPYSFFWS